ncbi:hypothetical protein AB0G98_17175 [Streptomyces sp. NPDC020196]
MVTSTLLRDQDDDCFGLWMFQEGRGRADWRRALRAGEPDDGA